MFVIVPPRLFHQRSFLSFLYHAHSYQSISAVSWLQNWNLVVHSCSRTPSLSFCVNRCEDAVVIQTLVIHQPGKILAQTSHILVAFGCSAQGRALVTNKVRDFGQVPRFAKSMFEVPSPNQGHFKDFFGR